MIMYGAIFIAVKVKIKLLIKNNTKKIAESAFMFAPPLFASVFIPNKPIKVTAKQTALPIDKRRTKFSAEFAA